MRAGRIGFVGGVAALVLALAPVSVDAGESAEAIFEGGGVTSVGVSPTGEWVVATAQRMGADDDQMIVVQRVGAPGLANVLQAPFVGEPVWDAANRLLVPMTSEADVPSVMVIDLSFEAGKIAARHRKIAARGILVDGLPTIPNEVLWEFPGTEWISLHRISIDELLDFHALHRIDGKTIDIAEKVATVNGETGRWVVSRDGRPRAVLRFGEGFTALMMPSRVTRAFETVYRFEKDEDAVHPAGLTADESKLLVFAYAGKNTLGLYEWDERRATVGNPVFVHPDYDLTRLLRDGLTGELIAVAYESQGSLGYHYFETYRKRFLERLPKAWQKDSVAITSSSADRQVIVFHDSSATNPGDFHLREPSGRALRIGRSAENVDRAKLSPVEAFEVEAKDGTRVEAFLAVPRGSSGKAPLVVMPHGGPVGVRDSRRYDPLVQYLASWGFAVLQVNYRGSSGYGIEFEKAGQKQWARGIEDDIDAAVEHAMKRRDVDANRICIVGGSYGGFSSFASVIRHRDRYRCAVSMNGVSDIPLLADSSDMADSKQVMRAFEERIGNLESERERLIEASPAYHVEQIEVPTLVVYGTEDRRVDPDHAHRMILMFELLQKEHESLEVEGAGHGFHRDEGIIVARTLRRFLTAHLRPGEPFEPDPRSRYD